MDYNEIRVLKRIKELNKIIEDKVLDYDSSFLNEGQDEVYAIARRTEDICKLLKTYRLELAELFEAEDLSKEVAEDVMNFWTEKTDKAIKLIYELFLMEEKFYSMLVFLQERMVDEATDLIEEEIAEFMMFKQMFMSSRGNAKIKFQLNKSLDNVKYILNEMLKERLDGHLKYSTGTLKEALDETYKIFDLVEKPLPGVEAKDNSGKKNIKVSTFNELIKIAKDNGFEVKRSRGSHFVVQNEDGKSSVIPYKSNNGNIGKGLTQKILKDISVDD